MAVYLAPGRASTNGPHSGVSSGVVSVHRSLLVVRVPRSLAADFEGELSRGRRRRAATAPAPGLRTRGPTSEASAERNLRFATL